MQIRAPSHKSSVQPVHLLLQTPETLTAAWLCLKQRQQLLLQGLHPSRAGCRIGAYGAPAACKSGRTAAGADHGCRPSHGLLASWLRRVSVPWLLLLRRLRDTLRTFAKGRVAQHPVDLLGLGVGILSLLLGLAITRPLVHLDQLLTVEGAWSMACLTGKFCSQITSRFVARAWPGPGGSG